MAHSIDSLSEKISRNSVRIATVGLIFPIIKIPASKRDSHSRSGSNSWVNHLSKRTWRLSDSCEPTKHFSTHFLPTARRVGVRRKYTTHADLFCKHCQVDDPSRLGGQKEPVYPVILLAMHTCTLIFSGFFGRESGPKNKRPLLRFFEHPPCPRPRSVTEKRLRRFNWTRADALESIPVALQSRFSALRISST